jgi:hypothetical protein
VRPELLPVGRLVTTVLPELKSLIKGIHGWDVEERAPRVVVTALDVIPGVSPSRRARHEASAVAARLPRSTSIRLLRGPP